MLFEQPPRVGSTNRQSRAPHDPRALFIDDGDPNAAQRLALARDVG